MQSLAIAKSPNSTFDEPLWCGRKDLNLHGLPHQNLNLARLPIPPRPPVVKRRAANDRLRACKTTYYQKPRGYTTKTVHHRTLYIPRQTTILSSLVERDYRGVYRSRNMPPRASSSSLAAWARAASSLLENACSC